MIPQFNDPDTRTRLALVERDVMRDRETVEKTLTEIKSSVKELDDKIDQLLRGQKASQPPSAKSSFLTKGTQQAFGVALGTAVMYVLANYGLVPPPTVTPAPVVVSAPPATQLDEPK